MYLLAAQIANNAPDETVLMAIGIAACIGAIVLLLWKNEAKASA